MKILDVLEESFIAISANKVRSGLTVLGIVIGIASVIALTAVGQGSQASITANIESAGSNLLTVSPGFRRAAAGCGGALRERQDAQDHRRRGHSPTVGLAKAVAPQVTGRYQIVGLLGQQQRAGDRHHLRLSDGAQRDDRRRLLLLRPAGARTAPGWPCSGPQIATDLFGDPAAGGTDPIGQTIRIKTSKFTVIGVTAAKGGFGPENADNAIYRAAQRPASGSWPGRRPTCRRSASRRSTRRAWTSCRPTSPTCSSSATRSATPTRPTSGSSTRPTSPRP